MSLYPAPTPPARAHCLIVTALPLDDLAANRHGIYQRLRMLMTAMARTGLALDVVCAEGPFARSENPLAPQVVVDGLDRHWGLQARVVGLTHRVRDVRAPYVVQQLIGCLSHRWSPGMRSAVAGGQLVMLQRALDTGPSLILAHRLNAMALLAQCHPLPPCVFDMDDIEHVVHLRRMHLSQSPRERWFAKASLPALARAERHAVQSAWKTLVCARDDAQLLAEFCQVPQNRISVVPNGLARPARTGQLTPDDGPPVMLMVGIYSYEPNSEGARHFIEAIWPLIRRVRPDAQTWFVGANPEAIGQAQDMPEGVRLLGFVDDIEAVYAQASVVLCPILTGGGTRVKLIEAALRGKAIVSTTLGAEGLGFTDGEQARLCDSPQAFAQACVDLLAAGQLARRMGEAARTFAEKHYDRDLIADRLAAECIAQLTVD